MVDSIFCCTFVLANNSTTMFASFRPAGKNGDYNAYILKSFRRDDGSTSTVTVKKLGRLSSIASEHPGIDPRKWVEDLARELTRQESEQNNKVTLVLNPSRRTSVSNKRLVHGGDLLLHGLFYRLGLDSICDKLREKGKFQYDICDILKKLVYGRILFPDSKLGTWEQSQSFIEKPDFQLEDIYKALSVFARESDLIQSQLYHNSKKISTRNTQVIYYDCTNYYFEIEQADKEAEECRDSKELEKYKKRELRKYGHSKENRPNPLVQLGMFMDADGVPLGFCVNPGNTAETQTLQPLEEKLADNFNLSDFVCCTDGGLGSRDNRKYNMTEGRDYITVQSLKGTKISESIRDWALKDADWTIAGYEGTYTKEEARALLGDKFAEAILIKDRWAIMDKDGFEEHLIVTYSQKYADYMKATRDAQIARAAKQIALGMDLKKKSPNDCRRFIKETNYTDDGEPAEKTAYSIDQTKINQEAKFDGIYAIATSLDDTPTAVLRANHFRYEIEHLFRITKTNLELRPIFLSRSDRIIGHFIICFIALVMLKQLQREVNNGVGETDRIPVEQIQEQLAQVKYLYHEAVGYEPAFNNTNILKRLQNVTGQIIDNEIISKSRMKSLLKKPISTAIGKRRKTKK